MRLLFLMRGNCASGKSTFIEKYGLTPFTLSTDEYRIRMAGLELLPDGSYSISQAKNPAVFKQLKADLESRMEQGLTTVIDATNTRASDMADYIKLAKKYRYRPVVIDFSGVSADECKHRNALREPAYKRVSDAVIDKFAERLSVGLPKDFAPCVIDGTKDNFLAEIDKLLFDSCTEKMDGKYDNVVVVGDIHGCYDALAQGILCALGFGFDSLAIPSPFTLAQNVQGHSNVKFVFVGDYIDRGIQNDKVVDFLYEIRNLPNVKLLMGNHEHNVEREMRGENIARYSETVRTIKSLGEERVKKLHEIVRKCGMYYVFELNWQKFLCVHNAISQKPCLDMSANTLFKGCGAYEDSLKAEKAFLDNTGMCLIHGHRNVKDDPIVPIVIQDKMASAQYAFNLCDTVEHGGFLRLVKLWSESENDLFSPSFNPYMVKNTVFRKPTELTCNVDVVTQLLKSPMIRVKDLGNGVSSFNFKREVFFNDKFDALTCKARGLYIYDDGSICARGYDKFFNAWADEQVRGNEQADREFGDFALADLSKKNVQFPVQVSAKENGYLGLLSYNKLTDDFFIATKSQDFGDFADWFKEILKPYLTDKLKQDLKELNCTAIFEVIDPNNDPHIIRYNNPQLVLLDLVENEFETAFYDKSVLLAFAESHGFIAKSFMDVSNCYSVENLTKWLQDRAKYSDEEGFVVRDASGYMFKVKSNYYSFWKGLRTAFRALQAGKPVASRNRFNPRQAEIVAWMQNNPEQVQTAKSIMDIRDAYNQAKSV